MYLTPDWVKQSMMVIDAIHRYVPYLVNTDGIVPLKVILSNAPWYVWLRLAI